MAKAEPRERGEFHFNGLEDLEYNGYVDGTVPKWTVVTQAAGGARFTYPNGVFTYPNGVFTYPNGVVQHSLHAGARNVRWEVLVFPGSSLKAAE